MSEKSSGVTAQIRVRRCYGCGAILQDQYPDEKGYIPPEKFQNEDENLCQRCYKLRHYSTYKEAPSLNNEYITILNDAKKNNDLIVYVLNAFTMNSSFITNISNYLSDNILVIVNKRDIVSYISDLKLLDQCERLLAENNIKAKDIVLTSSANNNASNIEDIFNKIEVMRNGKSVYFIGVNQVGKSSLVNSLLRQYKNNTTKMITTSPYPHTTLDVISIPLDESSYIYDTPGIENPDSIISHVEPSLARFLLPRDKVKGKTESLKPGQSIVISNFFRLDLLDGKKATFTYYFAPDLPVSKINLAKANSYIDSLKNESNCYLTNKVTSYNDMTSQTFNVSNDMTNVLRIFGLGYFEFKGEGLTIQTYNLNGVKVILEHE